MLLLDHIESGSDLLGFVHSGTVYSSTGVTDESKINEEVNQEVDTKPTIIRGVTSLSLKVDLIRKLAVKILQTLHQLHT